MLEQLITSAVTYLATLVFGSIVTWATLYYRNSKRKDDAVESALKCLIRASLLQMYRYHVQEKRDITAEEHGSFESMAESYLCLKGHNGYIESIIKEFMDAPVSYAKAGKP